MKAKHLVGFCAIALFTVGCGYSIKTAADNDRSVRFSNYQSFFVLKGNSSGDPLMDQRARTDVAAALVSKGWMEVSEGLGHAAVVVHAATKTTNTYERLYDGWGDWNWRAGGFGGTTKFVNDYQVGTLVVDIFDAKTKQAIWHGFASDALSNNSKPEATEQAVEKMFSHFPPVAALASLSLAEKEDLGLSIKNDQLRLLFSEQPAILILIDGAPVYRSIEGTSLERIINTKPFIVRDTSGIHYLKVFDGWMEAYMLTGVWSVSDGPPSLAEPPVQQAIAALTADLLETSRFHTDAAPTIFISTEPAELIVTDGPPRFAAIEGTSLQYVENTTAKVFKEPTDDELFVLTSGGWFHAWRKDGPWQFVPSSKLPADLAAIR